MGRRPMCSMCLLLVILLGLADWMGIPLIRGNPLPAELKIRIEREPECFAVGEVERCVDTENSQSVYLKSVSVIYHSKRFSIGKLRIFLKKRQKLPAGSLILVQGILEEIQEPRNPGEFNSKGYYGCRHIYYLMKKGTVVKKSRSFSRLQQFFIDAQEKFGGILDRAAGKSAPLFRAIVLGDKKELETVTRLRYQMAGIIHILAISGLHISVLGVGLYKLLKKVGLGIWPSGLLSLVIMLGYGMMTGGSVSTVRAVVMFLIRVGARILGRIYDLPTACAVAGILILLESPAYLLDGGFWMSFGAVLGVGVVLPALQEIVPVKQKLGQGLLGSLAVQLTTLPVTLWFYGEVSVAGVFLNLLVLPTVGVVLGSGVLTALTGLGWSQGAAFMALPGRFLLWGYELLCIWSEKLPFCTWIVGQPQLWQIVVYYGIFAGVLIWWKWGKGAAVVLAVGIGLLAWRPVSPFRITCLDIGQGDAIVLETPSGQTFLVDGGSSNKKGICQYQILPYLKSRGISRVDGVFISHTDGDHISGIREFLELQAQGAVSVKIKALILPAWKEPPREWRELADLAKKGGVSLRTVKEGDVLAGRELTFRILSPWEGAAGENVNEEGMVMEVSYGEFLGLFTGDIGMETEEELLKKGVLEDVDFLKVGHHGSRHSSGEGFLEVLCPELGVISVSEKNTYGHPSPEAVFRLKKAGTQVFCTKDRGALITEVTKEGEMRCYGRVRPSPSKTE